MIYEIFLLTRKPIHFRLETYTLRSGYSTVMEAEAINGRTNACPSSQTPICLVGLRPFLGAKYLEVGDNFLVLLASGTTFLLLLLK
jgi:hypothetical protein